MTTAAAVDALAKFKKAWNESVKPEMDTAINAFNAAQAPELAPLTEALRKVVSALNAAAPIYDSVKLKLDPPKPATARSHILRFFGIK